MKLVKTMHLRSNTAGRTTKSIGCRRSRLIWFRNGTWNLKTAGSPRLDNCAAGLKRGLVLSLDPIRQF
jgi:hypothetical protein